MLGVREYEFCESNLELFQLKLLKNWKKFYVLLDVTPPQETEGVAQTTILASI